MGYAAAAATLAAAAFALGPSPGAALGDTDSATLDDALRDVAAALPVVSPEEVARHATPDDAWVIISGVAYDITSLLAQHPGGSGILEKHAGRDVTREFLHLSHSARARRLLPGLAVGRLPADYTPPPLPSLADLPPQPQPTAPGSKRVVVVGAGICGVAVAAMLAERGHAVTVVDGAPLVGGTALRSTAIVYLGPAVEKLQRERGEPLTEWAGEAAEELLSALPGVGWVARGTLGVITDADILAATTAKFAPGGSMFGKGELISRERMLELEPALSPALLGASLHPRGSTVDPFLVCHAYASRAREAGARFALGHRVVGIERRAGGGFAAVVERIEGGAGTGGSSSTASERQHGQREAVEGDELIIATGWLCRPLAAQLGYDVPVAGVHGQLFTTKCDAVGALQHNIFSWEGPTYWNAHREAQSATLRAEPPHERLTNHFYAVQASNGVLKIGGDRIRLPLGTTEGLNGVTPHIDDTISMARSIFPGLASCEISGAWSGTMPATPNQTPYLGRLEPGLWVMAGAPFSRAPAYALLVAEALSGGAPPGSVYAAMLSEADPHRPAQQRPAPLPPPPAETAGVGAEVAPALAPVARPSESASQRGP